MLGNVITTEQWLVNSKVVWLVCGEEEAISSQTHLSLCVVCVLAVHDT